MKVVSTFHQPSSVNSSLKCSLTADSELGHLVVAKANRLEVSSITAEGLKVECSLEIWGRVLFMKAVPAADASISNLLVLLDHPQPKLLLLKYDASSETPYLKTAWSSDLYDRHARHAEFFTDIVTSAFGEVAVVSCYVGKLKVVCFDKGKVSKDFDVILPELNLCSLTFVETDTETYTLAILHYDHLQRLQLLARDLDVDGLELSITLSVHLQRAILPSSSFPETDIPPTLVPVPSFALAPSGESEEEERCLGGVLVLGGRKILFVEAATVDEQRYEKGKEKRQQQRKTNASEKSKRQAQQKEKEREAKKVKPRAAVKWPWSEVTAWCPADDDGRRFFIGDMFGRLSLLTISDSPELILLPIGEISAPTTLSYLSSQVLFVGSHTGDAQIIRVLATAQDRIHEDTLPIPTSITTVLPTDLNKQIGNAQDDEDADMEGIEDKRPGKGGKVVALKGAHLEVLDRYRNIAPILDAVMADTDNSGQPQIVTCSGDTNTGSFNIVRTGADFQDLAVLRDIPHISNVFPIRDSYEQETDTHILLSTLHESHLIRIDGRTTFTRIDPKSTALTTDQPTLSCSNIMKRVQKPGVGGGPPTASYVDSALVVQATPKGIKLVEYDATLGTFNLVGEWKPEQVAGKQPREVIAASLNASQFVVALSGGTLVLLNLLNGQLNVAATRNFLNKEISAVSCAPLDRTKKFAWYIAIAFWDSNEIELISLKDTQRQLAMCRRSAPLPALPCSIVLHNFGTGNKSKDADFRPYVVAGLADGSVAMMSLVLQEKAEEMRDLKFFPLGNTPVSLGLTKIDDKQAVFASGSRAAVLYWDRQRVHHSAVMLKDVKAGASLNMTPFPSCQILATSTSLHIGQIRGVDKMQIRTVPLGLENPRRIAYHPALNVFGVVGTKNAPHRIGDAQAQTSTFNLYDGTTFAQLYQQEWSQEDVTAVKSLADSDVPTTAAFCVGMMQVQHGEYEPSIGRLVLFGVSDPQQDVTVVAEAQTEGCVYAIDTVNGMIAAAVNTSVDLYCITVEGESTKLSRVARWNHNYYVTSLVVNKDRIIIGDAVSSVSVLKVEGQELKTVARDYAPLWPLAIEATRDEGVIGSNLDCNLFTFGIQEAEGRKRLERNGHYHIGETITRFIPGGLSAQDAHDAQLFEPEHVFFTSTGRIGLVSHVQNEVALDLTALQRNMSAVLPGAGDINHTKWRTPSNARGGSDAEQSFGFLDGDFLEQFLGHESADKFLEGKNRAEKIKLRKEAVVDMLEKLQGLH